MNDPTPRGPRKGDWLDALERELEGLQGPEREEIDTLAELGPEERLRLERENVELWGLLAYQAEPLEPAPRVLDEILEALTRATRPQPPAKVVETLPRWLPLAAGLTFVSFALSGWLFLQLGHQRTLVAELATRVETLQQGGGELEILRARFQEEREKLALVTSPGVELCALRPTAEAAASPTARGVLWVAANHEHWYLSLHGLSPCPKGRAYQLWFIADEGPVSAGTFAVVEGARIELSSGTMPAGTRAVAVTLELEGGAPEPSGPRVLYGDEVMQVL